MEEIKKYDNYKDSGIEWIGEIPEHWECKMIKRLSPVKRGASPRPIDNPIYFDNNGEYSWVRIADVSASERYLENTEQILSELGASLSVKRNPGDFFLSIAGTVGKPIISKIKCCIHDGFVYFPDLKINPEFLYYLFTTGLPYKGLGKWGTQLNLNTDTVGEIYIPVPLETEIESLVSFLDRKTAEIDQIIANKQKLIALYEEEKQAIINQAVTKGLDPTVKLKESGVEWLGEIPEHWEVKKLNYCFGQIGSGTTPTSGKPEYYENGEFNWLQTGDLNDSEIIETSKKITQKALDDNSTLRFYPLDSIVIAMYGATIGKTGILKIESTTNQACCVLSKPRNMFPKFVFYWFNAVKKHIISLSYGGGQPNINQEQIRSLKIQQPPIDEQKNVVEYIDNELSRLSVIIEKFNKQIDLLQEYRTTLISEVVTGKIKVPNTIEA